MDKRGSVFLGVPAQDVRDFHNNDDVDHDRFSHHHTLGTAPNQAAAGNHYTHKGRYDVTDLLIPAAANFTSNTKLTRKGNVVDLRIDVTSTIATGGGAGSILLPAEHTALSVAGNRYFAGADVATGNLLAVFWTGTQFAHIFGRAAGAGTLAHITYLAID